MAQLSSRSGLVQFKAGIANMKKLKRLICLHLPAFIIVTLASGAFAQTGMVSNNGLRENTRRPRPMIVNPRTSTASPMISSLNISGTWSLTDCTPDGNCTLVINQDQSGNITGSVDTLGYCPVPVWPVSGAVTGSTTFTITATDPDGGDDTCDAWFTLNMTMTSSTSASGPWDSSVPNTGTDTMTMGETVVLIDPVASGLLDGNEVTEDTDAITAVTNPKYISGGAADGVTQVLVEVTGVQPGDSVQLTLLNELGQQDSEVNNGGLFQLGGDPDDASSTLPVTAQSTTPPMAFAVWRVPANYNRNAQGVTSYPQDATTLERILTLQAQDTNPDGSPNTVSKIMWAMRPPVLLVHGMWSGPDAWNNFSATTNYSLWALMYKETANYNYGISGVTAFSPSYPWPPIVNANALGFAYNAQAVLNATQKVVSDFETSKNVAAVQADVVAHSMGGDIARAMSTLSTTNPDNYGMGPVHKLITIGTPHQGTPVAIDLLPYNGEDPNACVRKVFGDNGQASFQTVTIGTLPPVNGAVDDIATAPANLPTTEPFPMAYLAGSTNQNNLNNVGSTVRGKVLTTICASSPLAQFLTPTEWNNVFGDVANDGLVPVYSQLNYTSSSMGTGGNTYTGVIHTSMLTALGFAVPSELDSGSGIPDAVVNLLNEATNGPDFH